MHNLKWKCENRYRNCKLFSFFNAVNQKLFLVEKTFWTYNLNFKRYSLFIYKYTKNEEHIEYSLILCFLFKFVIKNINILKKKTYIKKFYLQKRTYICFLCNIPILGILIFINLPEEILWSISNFRRKELNNFNVYEL